MVVHKRSKPGNKNSLNEDFLMSVLADHLGYIWAGTSNSGLNKYNPKTGKFKVYKYNHTDNNSLSNNGVVSLCEDHNGNIWAGTWWGLNVLIEKAGSLIVYFMIPPTQTVYAGSCMDGI